MATEHGPRDFWCDTCEYRFSTLFHAEQHERIEHAPDFEVNQKVVAYGYSHSKRYFEGKEVGEVYSLPENPYDVIVVLFRDNDLPSLHYFHPRQLERVKDSKYIKE